MIQVVREPFSANFFWGHFFMLSSFSVPSQAKSVSKYASKIIAALLLLSTFAGEAQAQTTVAGVTSGELSVNRNGAAQYRLPLSVPPGVSGMSPELTLLYNSQSDNGPLGVGWSLGGLSVVHRCTRTVAQDGAPGGVDYGAADRFCMDGQRLVAINGVYGADGTEYRTEIETFTRVVSLGSAGAGPASFKVWTRDGRIMSYGTSADSAVEVPGQDNVQFWALNKIEDRLGNEILFSYAEKTGTDNTIENSHKLLRIDYGGNPLAGTSPLASVRFNYQARNDKRTHYAAGAKTQWLERLSGIETYSGTNLVKHYKLAYDYGLATKRSRLTSVTECDNSDNCIAPVSFSYSDPSQGSLWLQNDNHKLPDVIENYSLYPLFPSNPPGLPHGSFADLNGDGLADWVRGFHYNAFKNHRQVPTTKKQTWLKIADGWETDVNFVLPDVIYDGIYRQPRGVFADLNGDGLVDWITAHRHFGSAPVGGPPQTYRKAWLNTGTGWAVDTAYTPPDVIDDRKDDVTRSQVVDVNGDGLPDFVTAYRLANSTVKKATWLNTGSGWAYAANYNLPDVIDDRGLNLKRGQFQDVNGDGLIDWVRAYRKANGNSSQATWLNTGSGWQYDAAYNLPDVIEDKRENLVRGQFQDVNGDGLVDWVRAYRKDNGTSLKFTLLNTGTGWAHHPEYDLPDVIEDKRENLVRGQFQDVNGDGLVDWIRSYRKDNGTSSKFTLLNTGSGWLHNPDYDLPDIISDKKLDLTRGRFADVNGDGLPDWVRAYKTSSGSSSQITWTNRSGIPDLLIAVSDSLKTQSEILYAPLTDKTIYSKSNGAVFPKTELQSNLHVVTELSQDDGATYSAGQKITSYKYSGARFNAQGRGFLGFREIMETDLQTGNITTKLYEQDYRFRGLLSENRIETSDGALKEKSSFTWSASETEATDQPSIILATLASARVEAFEINHGATNTPVTVTETRYTYDSHGNPVLITSTTQGAGESFTTVTRNSYGDDPSLWLLGLLTRSELEKSRTGRAAVTRTMALEYNATNGQLTKEIIEPDIPTLTVTTSYSYDSFGNETRATVSGVGITSRGSTNSYDANGQFPVFNVNAMSHSETMVTDPRFGVVTGLTGPNGVTTTWQHDGFGRKTKEMRADGTESRIAYELCVSNCPSGAVYNISIQDFLSASGTAIAGATIDYFDKLNRVIRNETEGFDTTAVYRDTHFNNRGLPDKTSRPYFAGTDPENVKWIENRYDVVDRRIALIIPDNGQHTTAYDGLTTTLSDPLLRDEIRSVNALNELVSVTDRDNGTVSYAYDAYGNLLTTNANGVLTTISYDQRGRKTGMVDPDMGTWSYGYNVLGELISQTDAKLQVVTMSYDLLGRMETRIEAEGTTTWTYDTATKGVGKIHHVSGPNGYQETAGYDSLGRPDVTTTTISGTVYQTSLTYDALGRPSTITYPSGFTVQNNYTANGFLGSVSEILGGTVYWQANTVDAEGMVTQETLGNGVITDRAYDPATALVDSIQTNAGGTSIQNLSFAFDMLGNLQERNDLDRDRKEAFLYDGLNRLTESKLTDTSTATTLNTTTYAYDALGNITNKSDVGAYLYGQNGAGPHAVTTAGANTYTYDANGSMISGAGRTTAWTSFNKPQSITDSLTGNQTSFVYGPSRARIQQNALTDGITTTTTYIGGSYERRSRLNQPDELVHYIRSGGGTVAIYTQIDDGQSLTDKTRYLHKDHLGSVESITDEQGVVTEHLSYDAHGKRRLSDWNAGTPAAPSETPRGFTGHEHLDGVGLIHMNGRVYAPTLGRFLSADPNVQHPDITQSFNRYSYIINNPLSATDPSGFEILDGGPIVLDPITVTASRGISSSWGGILTIFGDVFLRGGFGQSNVWYSYIIHGSVFGYGGGDGYGILISAVSQQVLQRSSVGLQNASLAGISGFLHGALTVGSFAPSIIGSTFALLDAGLYALEGNWAQVGMAAGAAAVGLVASAGAAKVAMVVATKVSRTAGRAGADVIADTVPRSRMSGARQLDYWDFDGAEALYDTIRRTDDVGDIARHTGLPKFQVQRVKDHIFSNTHQLDDVVRRFDADPLIANAWQRFGSGSHTSADLQLFRHELFESKFEGIFKTSYRKAHDAANRAGRPSGLE